MHTCGVGKGGPISSRQRIKIIIFLLLECSHLKSQKIKCHYLKSQRIRKCKSHMSQNCLSSKSQIIRKANLISQGIRQGSNLKLKNPLSCPPYDYHLHEKVHVTNTVAMNYMALRKWPNKIYILPTYILDNAHSALEPHPLATYNLITQEHNAHLLCVMEDETHV